MYLMWAYGLAVMTSGLHPVGPRFDPGYALPFHFALPFNFFSDCFLWGTDREIRTLDFLPGRSPKFRKRSWEVRLCN